MESPPVQDVFGISNPVRGARYTREVPFVNRAPG